MPQEPSSVPASSDDLASVPVVAIGASAGGLAAISAVLQALEEPPNLSIIVSQHLSREHESALVSILQRSTRLLVVRAEHDMEIEPNRVYVAPPDAAVILERSRLKLIPRVADAGVEHPIDRLFHSVAAERGPLSVGVVLSGAGSDGCNGVKAIKAASGITLAQDASAEFGGMPSSAIATGCVDFVLSPTGIAEQLGRLARRLPIDRAFSIADEEFRRILVALRRATGMEFGGYKEATVRRRVERRCLARRVSSLKEYLELVEREPAEAKTLAEEVLIHVTSFFRDPAVFDAVRRKVLPQLLGASPGTIRVWVPGCSTGEEVYSIGISLLELMQHTDAPPAQIQLFGTDASAAAIQTARAACYSEGIENSVSAEHLRKYFVHVGGVYRVCKELRDACVFARHDVTRDPPFTRVDLISCRNLMIYLTAAAQERLLPLFHYALNESGFLLLGPAETARAHAGFSVIDEENRIYVRVPGERRLPFALELPHQPDPAPPSERTALPRSRAGDLGKLVDRIILEKFAPCGVVVTSDLTIVQFRGKTGRFLELAAGVARFDLRRMVRDDLRIPLRKALDEASHARSAQCSVRATLGDGRPSLVQIDVLALEAAGAQHFLVLFRESALAPAAVPVPPLADEGPESSTEKQLRAQLVSAREYLETVIEQLEQTNEELRAANEEISSNNEELRSTNEELHVAKEELQASNQELVTVNDEMGLRNQEVTRLADDVTNLLNSVELPVLLLDREAKIRRFTPAAAELLGLGLGDVGRELTGLKRPFAADCVQMALEVSRELRPVTRTIQGADGRWHLFRARPYLTVEHKVEGSVISAFDIDAVAGTSFRELLSGATEGLLMVEESGRVVFANQVGAALFGYSPDDLLGLPVEALLPEPKRGEHRDHRARYLAAASPRPMASSREVLGLRRDGKTVPIEVTLNPARGQHGQLVIAFVRDITERRKAELEIQTYQSRLQHMAFDAAVAEEHERRRIALNLHDRIGQGLALARIKLSTARDAAAGAAREAIDDAMLLLAESLESARTLTFDLSPPILYDLGLKEALSWLAEDLQRRFGLRVTLRLDAGPTPLEDAHAALVFRAVRELLVNVLKHAHSPEAQLSLETTDGWVKISVEDHGVGFDPAAARPGDAGFGLMSVREQITRLGGALEIVSALGQGTRTTISVPLAENGTANEPNSAT